MAGVYSYSAIRREGEGAASELKRMHVLEGKDEQAVEEYLLDRQIPSLSDIDPTLLKDYRGFIKERMGDGKKALHYCVLLESVVLYYLMPYYEGLCQIIDDKYPLRTARPLKNKLMMFLMLMKVTKPEEITFDHRLSFEEYLREIDFGKKGIDAIKMLDKLKLDAIEEENRKSPWKERKLSFTNGVIYLGYHPDFQMAMEFYYLRDKSELVFDFSLPAKEKVKRQILDVLNDVLTRKAKRKNRRELYLVPLKKLYLFCADEGIEDLEQLTASEVKAFRKSMDGKVGTKTNVYMEIVYTVRRYLFLSAKETNWDANVWFMDRFTLKDDRVNPAYYKESFRFDTIENPENRCLMKQYMKYEIGISSRALNTVLGNYGRLMTFMAFCDREGIAAEKITPSQMDRYMESLEDKDIQEMTFNASVRAINAFYQYLVYKRLAKKVPFEASYYKKKAVYIQKDRCVSEENQMSLLLNLKYFPEHLRLMCLNIWATGIRVNEVCTILGDAYSFDGEDAYLTVTQYKMVSKKQIPIPKTLYFLMREYIRKNAIGSDEYVFKNRRGGAYQASTFRSQVQRLCQEYQIGDPDYIYRPHDFRHLVATQLFDTGASLQAIRDYHGHRDANMTRKYIDYTPRKVDAANKAYFSQNDALLLNEDDDR